MFVRMLSGPTIFRAPENDEGADADIDLDEDFSLDEPDDELDEPDEDAGEIDELDLEDVDEPPPAKTSRRDARVEAATKTAAEAKREAAELRERIAQMEARSNEQPRETAVQREQRLANLEPWERTEALWQEDSAAMRQQLARIEWESKETADKAAYESLCTRASVAAKLKDEVETRLTEMRKAGTTAPRETVLRWVIGDRALANGNKAAGKARNTAAGNRDRQATRPSNGRGDVAPEGRRGTTDQARQKRLDTYQL